ncbi:MAG: GerW family sporulation protein [Clostridia bacterium]|nr:GerW family sporulation protein [Clostridia bacterium]
MAKNVNELLGVSMERIKQMVDVDTVVGTPITVGNVTLIPVSKITYGFAGGGSDLPTKSDKELFGGGSGAGISVTPIAFLVVNDGRVTVTPLIAQPDSRDKLVSMIPEVVDKVSDLITKNQKNNSEPPLSMVE